MLAIAVEKREIDSKRHKQQHRPAAAAAAAAAEKKRDMIQFMPMESVICVACRYISAVCMIVWAVL